MPDTDAGNNPEDSSPAAENEVAQSGGAEPATPAKKAAKKAVKKTAKKAAKKAVPPEGEDADTPKKKPAKKASAKAEPAPGKSPGAPMVMFQAPEKIAAPAKKAVKKESDQKGSAAEPSDKPAKKAGAKKSGDAPKATESSDETTQAGPDADSGDDGDGVRRRPRRRGGRRRRKGGNEDGSDDGGGSDDQQDDADDSGDGEGGSRRRRTRVRQPRNVEDEIASVSGSTRLEAKKQRRKEGREAGRRRAPIVSEAEFLARREAVDRAMVIRQRKDLTQIAVLEDKVLVEHYVARESQTSLIGNIYLGRVQNVLPSMEAAFIDIGKGRNAVLYAGEVNWPGMGHKEGQPRKIESVLSSGQTVLVQVSKDPVGQKGARLTGQISLPGRFLVYVPDGNNSGISRKLPDTERNRLKTLLKEIVPDTAGVIVRTAAEGASEEELTHDVERLKARWTDIEQKVKAGKSPELLYGEPDLTLKVVRDLFTEDFAKLVIEGDEAWDLVDGYVSDVAPDLRERLERFTPAEENSSSDVFAEYRVDEQIAKALDRKVWLPSGGSLVIDRTEAMTVVDVNTGKFTGSGGNLEETVTKNNLEAAEEVVRQLRLRDIGGIIVVDFIDMVLESNRDLVLRRLVECLGRDRTRHQVAEVTSLGLIQMTRKRIGTGLLEAFSEDCDRCQGRGLILHDQPVESTNRSDDSRGRRGRGGRERGRSGTPAKVEPPKPPSPKDLAGSKPPSEVIADPIAVEPATEPKPAGPDDSPGEAPSNASVAEAPESTEHPATHATPEASPEAPPETLSEPAAESAEVEADAQVVEAPPVDTSPKLVSSRRRRAARPAGPPVSSPTTQAIVDEPSQEPDPDSATADPDDHGVFSLLHVPIKKKGSRKR